MPPDVGTEEAGYWKQQYAIKYAKDHIWRSNRYKVHTLNSCGGSYPPL